MIRCAKARTLRHRFRQSCAFLTVEGGEIILVANAQDLRCAAGWRAGCFAGGMTAKAIRSGRWFGDLFIFFRCLLRIQSSKYLGQQ
jgi:hypothetical protein